MSFTPLSDISTVWKNGGTPVILRRGGSMSLRIRLPFAPENRSFLKVGSRKKEPEWNKEKKYWSLPPSRFNELVDLLLNRFGKVYIIQPHVETEKCASACMNAEGHDCQCSCLGANHGRGNDGRWFEISDSLAVRHGKKVYGSRLLTKRT
jgi:hypothetical protein